MASEKGIPDLVPSGSWEVVAPNYTPEQIATFRQPRHCPSGFSEHEFKTVNGHPLRARIWPAKNVPPGKKAPWVIWTHGGGWTDGNHLAPLEWYRRGFVERGYHLFTHSYRLWPQATWQDMVEDCVDAVTWARENIGQIVGEDKVDIAKLVISGDSAGGHLCMLAAHHLSPPPAVVLGVYAVTDMVAFVAQDRPPDGDWTGRWPEDELQAALRDRSGENYCSVALFEKEHHRFPIEEIQKRYQAPWLKYDERILLQSSLKQYLETKPRLFLTLNIKETLAKEEDYPNYLAKFSPFHLLESRKTYPPTVLLSGTGDAAVNFVEQSVKFADKMRELGLPVSESYQPGGPHSFDRIYTDENVEGWSEYIEPVLQWIQKQLG